MKDVSIKRLAVLLTATTVVAVAPAIQNAFAAPMPDGAGFEELQRRLIQGVMNAMNAMVSAWIGTLMAFFTRADRNAPVFALADQKDGE